MWYHPRINLAIAHNHKPSFGEDPLFEQTFRNINDSLRKDAGCSSELDYVEQTSWVLLLVGS